jgi:hypothetical protein
MFEHCTTSYLFVPSFPKRTSITSTVCVACRGTTDVQVFDESGDDHQLFGPGGKLFERLVAPPGAPTDSAGGPARGVRGGRDG